MLLVPLPVLMLLGVTLHFTCTSFPVLRHAVTSVGILLAGWIAWRKMTGALQKHEVCLGLVYGAACLAALAWHGASSAGPDCMRFGLIVSWVASSLIARQVAAWVLAGPTVDRERMQRWRVNVPQLIPHGLSLDCPELLTYTLSPLLLLASWSLSIWLLLQVGVGVWFWPVTFAVSLQLVWLIWHVLAILLVPFPEPDESLPGSVAAL